MHEVRMSIDVIRVHALHQRVNLLRAHDRPAQKGFVVVLDAVAVVEVVHHDAEGFLDAAG